MKFAATLGAAVLLASPALATTLKITVTSEAPDGGLSVTPVASLFHDGSYDFFDAGTANTSAGLELLAEQGPPTGLIAEFSAANPNGVATAVAQPANGAPPIEPGESGSAMVSVDGAINAYFSFATMIIPSNDTFAANDDAMAIRLFDDAGMFLGPKDIVISADMFYDLGTEVNDPADGAAFLMDVNGAGGTVEDGLITPAASLAAFAGLTTASGYVVDGNAIDFFGQGADFVVARITIEEISDVPLPAGAPLLLGGLLAFGWLRRRK